MKTGRIHILIVVAALAVVVGFVSFAARPSRSQTSRRKSESTVSRTVLTTKSTSFSAAASQNAILRNELNWTFGGKQQRGWYLYDYLIGKTLNIDNDALSH